jgi:demethylmenaquinone methyltransferase / 2-methoxy-6-polyprenyl-1,4-benzoquinol methylase
MDSSFSKDQVHHLFNAISSTYDRTNRILSLGIDRYWRNRVSAHIPQYTPLFLLDLATGTGDQVLTILNKHPELTAIGIDTAEEMLNKARSKASSSFVHNRVSFEESSAMQLPFAQDTFDALTMSFGIRNVACIETCFKEMYRVLKPGGQAFILEFSLPSHTLIKKGYLLYLRYIVPLLGKALSRHPTAYVYLNQTIETFPYGEHLCSILHSVGFTASYKTYTFGIVSLYCAIKPS